MKISDLNAAIDNHDFEKVENFLKSDGDLLLYDDSPLACALNVGDVAIIKRLLQEDAICERIQPNDARDILERAKNTGDDSLIRRLLQIHAIRTGIQLCDSSEPTMQYIAKIEEVMGTDSIDTDKSMAENKWTESMLSAKRKQIELDDMNTGTLANSNCFFSGSDKPKDTSPDTFLSDSVFLDFGT